MKKLLVVALVAACSVALAQSSAAKKELVGKILQLQQPAIEGMARAMAEQPAAQVMQGAGNLLQTRIPPDKREAIAKDIQADLKKYVDEAVPLVRERALKLAPTTIGAVLEEKFSEEELRQLIAIIESPVNRKFLQLGGEMQKALSDKLVADSKPAIEPKIRAMQQSVSARLGLPPAAAPAAVSSSAPRAPAKPASN